MRASARSAAVVEQDLKRGVNSLATIASIAPLLGVFTTVITIPTAFVGCAGERWACQAAMIQGLSASIWPTALGLLVGLISLWFYRYLAERLNAFKREMESATLDLVNQLARRRGRWTLAPTVVPVDESTGICATDTRMRVAAASVIRRWGFRRLLPIAQALLSGLLILADYFLLGVTDSGPYYPPGVSLIAEVVNPIPWWFTRRLLFLFGHSDPSSLSVIVATLPATAVCWYLIGAWLDGRSCFPIRHAGSVVRWMLFLLAAVIYLVCLADAGAACFTTSFWTPAIALSRWVWAAFFLYSQISACRERQPAFVLMRLSGRWSNEVSC